MTNGGGKLYIDERTGYYCISGLPPELTGLAYYAEIGKILSPLEKKMLRYLTDGFVNLGTFPTVAKLTDLFAATEGLEQAQNAVASLVCKRLVYLTEDLQAVHHLASGFSIGPTPHRVRLKYGQERYVTCAMETLLIGPLLQQDVTVLSSCGAEACDRAIELEVTPAALTHMQPETMVLFSAGWDGHGSISRLCCRNTLFFCSESCMEKWEAAHPEVPGLPFSSEMLRSVAANTGQELGALYRAMREI